MKKDVTASAAGAVAPKKPEFSLIDEDLLKSRIYTIRGLKVMLDADLAEIYGYSHTFREVVARGGMITAISIFTKSFVPAHTLAARILPRHRFCPLRHAQAPGPYLVT